MSGMPGMSGMSGMPGMGSNVRFHFSSNGRMGGMMDSSILDDLNTFNMGGSRPKRKPSKPPTLQRDLYLSLEELASGCRKRLRLSSEGIYGNSISKIFTIDIRPGWKAGTKITFPYPEYGSDIQFTVRETPHAHLKREGDNLSWQCYLTSSQAEKGLKITLKTPFPDEEVDVITKYQYIYEGKEMVIKGKGMPIKGDLLKRGDLVVRFSIR